MDVGISIPLILIIVILLAVIAVLVLQNVKRAKMQGKNTYVPPREEPKAAAGKFCNKCGAKLDADSAFCTNCGAKQ